MGGKVINTFVGRRTGSGGVMPWTTSAIFFSEVGYRSSVEICKYTVGHLGETDWIKKLKISRGKPVWWEPKLMVKL